MTKEPQEATSLPSRGILSRIGRWCCDNSSYTEKCSDCYYRNQEVYIHVTCHLIVVCDVVHAADGFPHFGALAVIPHCWSARAFKRHGSLKTIVFKAERAWLGSLKWLTYVWGTLWSHSTCSLTLSDLCTSDYISQLWGLSLCDTSKVAVLKVF